MRIDLRATSYPSLLEVVGLAIIRCDEMERAIPGVFRAALNVSLDFQREIFDATRGLEVHLKLTEAAVREGAAEFLGRWQELASRVRSSAGMRGKVAHAGLSIYGGGLIVEVDEDGVPTGIARRAGPPVASLSKYTRAGREEIKESEIRGLAERVLSLENEIRQLAGAIAGRRSQ
ncbi:hypothetical protein PX554_15960 [Sphingomonas sp. H39-1-10]|uniref:hypothetical protein n=1 Tax=Sphingomonas TaxID=13687 RepID=UPI00115FA920|nr:MULTISPECIES: hypothetical protein [Sphingomonas]MDF0489630.1 hypothetical protein [Sphingomonas pollutisoli]